MNDGLEATAGFRTLDYSRPGCLVQEPAEVSRFGLEAVASAERLVLLPQCPEWDDEARA